MAEDSQKTPRRAFFRASASKAIGPLGDFLDRRFRLGRPHSRPDDLPQRSAALPARHRYLLRPPGAVPEAEFRDTCTRCGLCVQACPAHAIFPIRIDDAHIDGTPVIDPQRSPCVVCEGLDCMHVCPSGALQLVEHPREIDMGLAAVDDSLCVRRRGEDCTICLDRCPFGSEALSIEGHDAPKVIESGCVGCGVCEFYCPTTPKAIVVYPHAR